MTRPAPIPSSWPSWTACARTYTGRPTPLTEVPRFAARRRRAGPHRAQARGPQPHRLAQDQQRARPGAAHRADGQDAGHRRDRSRPARGGHCDRRALLGLDCVVYMGAIDTRRQALNVARMKLLGAEVVPVDHRLADPQGRHQRGDPRLGDQRRPTRTTCSARSPGRTRSRRWCATSTGSSASRPARRCWPTTAGCPTPWPPASAVARTRSASSTRSSTTPACALHRLRGGRRRRGDRPARGDDHRRLARCSARHPLLPAAGRRRADHRVALDLRRSGLPGGRSRARLPGADSAGPSYHPITDTQAMDAFALLCRTEGIIPAIESAHALAGALELGRELGPGRPGPGQPLRARRQGRRDRRRSGSASTWEGRRDERPCTRPVRHRAAPRAAPR